MASFRWIWNPMLVTIETLNFKRWILNFSLESSSTRITSKKFYWIIQLENSNKSGKFSFHPKGMIMENFFLALSRFQLYSPW
jgi:hypothetical protein